jgi:PEP-CTERM motif
MKRRLAIDALIAAISLGGSVAYAEVITSATLQVGGSEFALNLTPDATKAGRFFFDETVGDLDLDGFEISAVGTLDGDPSISYGLTVTNGGTAPLLVSLTLSVPFAPLAASTVTSGITGTLTPGPLDALGLTLLPTDLGDGDGDGFAELMTRTDGVTNLGLDRGLGATILGALPAVYGPFAGGSVPGSPGLSALVVTVGLSLTGGGDVADLTGSTIVTAVPEPAAIALLTLGALVTATRRRARRRALE